MERHEESIGRMENILNEKNETIIRLKTAGRQAEKGNNSSYYSDMIKVLTKKIAERDEKIKELTRS